MGILKVPFDKYFIKSEATVNLSISYYNPRSLAFEPLIEKWDFSLDFK
jgi:hypothetical protein